MQVYFNTCFCLVYSVSQYILMLSIHRKRRKLVHYIVVAGIHYIFQRQKNVFRIFCKKSSAYPIYKIPSYDIIDEPEI